MSVLIALVGWLVSAGRGAWAHFASWRAWRWLRRWDRRQRQAEAAQKKHFTWLRRATDGQSEGG